MNKENHSAINLRFAVLSADAALFTVRGGELLIRLIRIDRPPHFPNGSGLPGGVIDPMDTAEDTVRRFVKLKGGIHTNKIYTEQLYTFSALDRDPRGRSISVAYLALVPWDALSAAEKASGSTAWWCPVRKARGLAFDHSRIVALATKRLRLRATFSTIIQKCMPREFTLTELKNAYEGVLQKKLDERNFRKRVLRIGILSPLPYKRAGGVFRPAQLYRFSSRRIREIEIL